MIVFDIKCAGGHVFESWFASSAAWEDQRQRRLVACPLCGDTEVSKALMAPNVGTKANRTGSTPMAIAGGKTLDDTRAKKALAALAKAQAAALENSIWVGNQFDSKARAMDAGETAKESIHGQVTTDQAKALIEDGIGVMPLPLPVVPPDERN